MARADSAEQVGIGTISNGDGAAPARRTKKAPQRPTAPTISVIVPTRNEAPNVAPLLRRCRAALADLPAEVIFADDSDDSTCEAIAAASDGMDAAAFRVHVLHRAPDERSGGLGGAVVAGLRRAQGQWVCVLDGDLQHPPEVITDLLERAVDDACDLVVASRYRDGGDAGGLGSPVRSLVSKAAGRVAVTALAGSLAGVSDPMSGFFLVRRSAVDPDVLRPDGYKILLEILVRTPGLRVAEVGFHFATRLNGTSKAKPSEGMRYLRHVARLRSHAAAPPAAVHSYDIHGIIAVESEGVLPELDWFQVRSLDRPADIRVRIAPLPAEAPRHGVSSRPPNHLRYTELRNHRGFAADLTIGHGRVDVTAAPLIARSPHVLYTNLVEPILRWQFVERGYALTHGACVVDDGDDAYLITARTDTGKTTTMLKLLDAHPLAFVADDLTILSPDGRVLPYPKPLTISKHTLHAVKRARLGPIERLFLPLQSRLHSRSGRRFAFLLTRTGIPVATTNTVVQLVIPPPKYPVGRLVPGVQIAEGGSLRGMFVIQRGGEGEELLDEDDALDILLRNCEDAYGFPPYERLEEFLLGSSGADLRAVERQIMAAALDGRPSTLLRSSTLDWATRIPHKIATLRGPVVIDLTSNGHATRHPVNGALAAAHHGD